MSTKNVDAAPPGSRPVSSKGDVNNNDEVEMEDADHEDVDEGSARRSKKKRRVIKITDKKYECPQPDCGKSYSRAEHLYRHQLNHTPKQIYYCDFPGCDRNFVRADLCARHKERHTAKGSHLQRKDAFMNSQRQQAAGSSAANDSATSGASNNNISSSPVDSAHLTRHATVKQDTYPPPTTHQAQTSQSSGAAVREYSEQSRQRQQQLRPVQTGVAHGLDSHLAAAGSFSAYPASFNDAPSRVFPSPSPADARRYSMDNQHSRPATMAEGYAQPIPMHPPAVLGQQPAAATYAESPYQPQGGNVTSTAIASMPSMPPLPPYGLPGPAFGGHSSVLSPPGAEPGYMNQMNTVATSSLYSDFDAFQFFQGPFMPVFNDGWNASPPSVDLMQQLATDPTMFIGPSTTPPPETSYDMQFSGTALPKREAVIDDRSPEIYAMDLSMRESKVSEKRQERLLSMVKSWEDIERMPGRRIKEEILSGDISDPKHPLSVEMLKTYLTSFWIHIHQQMPIMHQPSFNADTCPDLLLLAMMCLGACCLDRTHPPEHIKLCAELSFFAAYHIRWEVFKDAEFRPTAKLWTFQTMLLLELFEKMYSTRVLHERAHVHHATTLTVMKRGSSLIGRGANDEAFSDPTRTPPGPDGSINTSGQNTGDAQWNRWITVEATRRVAFAAFIIDSTHATLFGHAANMELADLKMTLPCTENLWAAESGAEVKRIERTLAESGYERVNFIEALTRTLSKKPVNTNVFGRIVIMAGLLNLSYNMGQRDKTNRALNQNQMGVPEQWKKTLGDTFKFWRRDFDEHQSKIEMSAAPAEQSSNKSTCHKDHRDNNFESRTCLHSLAHMSMHVSIVDCEIYAGSERVLGRMILDSDRKGTQNKIHEWAQTPGARYAFSHAVRFLRDVLIPDTEPSVSAAQKQQVASFTYSARDDYLLNRPYILYFACMVVFTYGFAMEGQLAASQYNLPATKEAQIWDMQQFLYRFTSTEDPERMAQDVERIGGLNRSIGLLILMRDCFEQPRWELLRESASMLTKCLEMLRPGLDEELKAFRQHEEQLQKHQQHQQQQYQNAYGIGAHGTGKMA